MTTSIWILIGALLLLAILQVGEKKFDIKRNVILPIIIVAYFSYKYIDGVPTGGNNTVILVSMIIGGIVFGILTVLATKVYIRDGIKYVKVGIPYVILWIIALGFKIVSVEYMTKWNILETVKLIMKYHINPQIISTSFMIFTIIMIGIRIIGIYVGMSIRTKKSLA